MGKQRTLHDMIREHEAEIEKRWSEMRRLIHTEGKSARCGCCGDFFDPDDNVYGYCSNSCYREAND